MCKQGTFEELLRMTIPSKDKDENPVDVSPDFRVAVQRTTENFVQIIIHPDGHNGETLDYYVVGNELKSVEKCSKCTYKLCPISSEFIDRLSAERMEELNICDK